MHINEDPKLPVSDEERARREQEDFLDEALKETFPASDPIAPGKAHVSGEHPGIKPRS